MKICVGASLPGFFKYIYFINDLRCISPKYFCPIFTKINFTFLSAYIVEDIEISLFINHYINIVALIINIVNQ